MSFKILFLQILNIKLLLIFLAFFHIREVKTIEQYEDNSLTEAFISENDYRLHNNHNEPSNFIQNHQFKEQNQEYFAGEEVQQQFYNQQEMRNTQEQQIDQAKFSKSFNVQEQTQDSFEFLKEKQVRQLPISFINCKGDCIDKGHNFCPTANKLGGTCYNQSESFTRVTMCSNDITNSNLTRYWACHNHASCGKISSSLEYTQALNVTQYTLTQTGDIVLNNVCNYLIKFPTTAKAGDFINFRVNKNDRADVYYTISKGDLNATNIVSSGTCTKSTKYQFNFTQQLYLSVISNNILAMDYNIYTWGTSVWVPPVTNTTNNTNTNTSTGTNSTTNTSTGTNNTNTNTSTGTNNTNTSTGTNTTTNNTGGTNNTTNNTNTGGTNNTNTNNTNTGGNGNTNTGGNGNTGGGDNNNNTLSSSKSGDDQNNFLILIIVPVCASLILISIVILIICVVLRRKKDKQTMLTGRVMQNTDQADNVSDSKKLKSDDLSKDLSGYVYDEDMKTKAKRKSSKIHPVSLKDKNTDRINTQQNQDNGPEDANFKYPSQMLNDLNEKLGGTQQLLINSTSSQTNLMQQPNTATSSMMNTAMTGFNMPQQMMMGGMMPGMLPPINNQNMDPSQMAWLQQMQQLQMMQMMYMMQQQPGQQVNPHLNNPFLNPAALMTVNNPVMMQQQQQQPQHQVEQPQAPVVQQMSNKQSQAQLQQIMPPGTGDYNTSSTNRPQSQTQNYRQNLNQTQQQQHQQQLYDSRSQSNMNQTNYQNQTQQLVNNQDSSLAASSQNQVTQKFFQDNSISGFHEQSMRDQSNNSSMPGVNYFNPYLPIQGANNFVGNQRPGTSANNSRNPNMSQNQGFQSHGGISAPQDDNQLMGAGLQRQRTNGRNGARNTNITQPQQQILPDPSNYMTFTDEGNNRTGAKKQKGKKKRASKSSHKDMQSQLQQQILQFNMPQNPDGEYEDTDGESNYDYQGELIIQKD